MTADELRMRIKTAGGRYWEYYEADADRLTVVMLADVDNKTCTNRVDAQWLDLAAATSKPGGFEVETMAHARDQFARALKLGARKAEP